jgi:hypothetical protein
MTFYYLRVIAFSVLTHFIFGACIIAPFCSCKEASDYRKACFGVTSSFWLDLNKWHLHFGLVLSMMYITDCKRVRRRKETITY